MLRGSCVAPREDPELRAQERGKGKRYEKVGGGRIGRREGIAPFIFLSNLSTFFLFTPTGKRSNSDDNKWSRCIGLPNDLTLTVMNSFSSLTDIQRGERLVERLDFTRQIINRFPRRMTNF